MLHVVCTRLSPGRLSVRVGDSSRRSEETVKKKKKISNYASQCDHYYYCYYEHYYHLQYRSSGLAVRCPLQERQTRDPVPFSLWGFSGHSCTADLVTLLLYWLPCQAPGDKRLALGLVGPVSVYCEWVR